ncbi:hypothetical protein [Dyella psychrodurans]|uniref:Fibronectin type-III domain-containing protein n=1 Tax=Dyella psychrodurans TaxID=1927960 RepID=A0A370WV64_9GAMM|nr:hypothetical protein [Dyella psychrodurans]RDS80033.1 hypothetical protein DWU99_19895 [Dyella psychrodurans]
MRAYWQGSCLWAVAMLVLSGACYAQSSGGATPDQEYQKLIQVDQNIEPLGEHPFGESISTYDGSVTFNVTDVTMRGNGPTITVGRTAQNFEWVPQTNYGPQLPLGSWDLDIPRIETLVGTAGLPSTAVWQTGVGGTTPTVGTTNRCSNFAPPPGIQSTLAEGGWVADEWWSGYNLLVPGEGKQQLMPRYSANTLSPTISGTSFNIVTKNNWMVTCGVTASDGGEGFLAIAPDGTRYTFAHLVYRPWYPIIGAGGPLPPDGTIIATQTPPPSQSAVSANGTVATQGVTPMTAGPGGLAILNREDALMYVTQIQDRFGNTLTYNYDPTTGYLSSITASDGREVDITYQSGSQLIQTITAKAANVPSRTWTYSYLNGSGALTGVQLPDGSAWSYNLGIGAYNLVLPSNACSLNQLPYSNTAPPNQPFGTGGTVTTPSGLTGTFSFVLKMSGRSYTPQLCWGQSGDSPPFEIPMAIWPEWYVQPAIASEVISGAGMPTQTWTYSYSPANASWNTDACASNRTCPTTVYTDVTDPNGNDTRYTYSNVFDSTEGQLLRSDTYSGAYGSTLVRSVVNTYANASNGPWPSVYGVDLAYRDNYYQTEQLAPLNQKVTTQDGQNYTWQTMTFNVYAQPTDVKRYNDIAGQSPIEETTVYLNDTNTWVLGLPQTVTNVGTGEVETSNTYNAQDLLQSRSRFGEFMMSYTYNSVGQLASFTDGNNHTTSLSNYYRGIPQSIAYPDSTSQSLVVNDLSEISSITDQAGYTTHYSYDPIGRISQITYPTNDPNGVSWYAKTFTYNYVASAERGIAAGHWDRITTTGNAVTTTYFDADLRPVLSDRSITGTANSDVTTATSYDYTGATTFASYPVSGSPAVTAVTTGTHHTYDALERLTQTQEDSELGSLTTSTSYLAGAGQQVTDPKGNVTTTYYQVFDEPDYKAPISVTAPGGITQTIARDIYGNPTSITQSGLYGTENDSVTKTLLYDTYHRLCLTTEPESGSTVMAYDAANNLQWSAQGQTITDGTCGQTDVASGAQTVRTYDAMNRVKTITPPAGTQTTSYTYDARGNIGNVVSGSATNTFAYNSRNLLTSQTLSVGSDAWGIGYNYDSYGHLNAIGYPAFNGSSEGVAYSPDALGRPTQAGSYASGIIYFPNDQVAGFNYGNGASYVAQQNARQLLSNFSYGVGSTLNLSEDFTYDNNGNITNVTDLVNGQRTKAFGYDALNRLTSATATNLYGTENYTYDALNNLRTRLTGGNTLTLNYDATNRLASVAQNGSVVTQYGYDAQGNRSSLTNGGATTNYTFDAENQLLQVPGLEGYAYDAAGRRVAKTNPSGNPTGYYFYDQAGQLMYSLDPNSLLATNYIYLGTKLIAKHVLFEAPAPGAIAFSSNPNGGSFTVSWGGVSQATSYTLQQLTVASGTWATVYSGASLSSAISGLAAGTYQYRVQACVSSGCGAWTSSSNVDVWPPLPSVTVPTEPVAGPYTISWTASANASSYTVQEAVNGGAWTTIGTFTGTSTTRPGATSGAYTYHVEAIDASGVTGGFGPVSNPVTVNTALIPSPTPTLSVPASSNASSATISWTAASPVTSYTLQESANGGSSWSTVYSGTSTSAAVSGLTDGRYTFQLRACNAPGTGTYCDNWVMGGSMVVALPPGTPTITPSTTSSNTGAYSLSWTAEATTTNYVLQQQINGGAWTTLQSSSATSWSVSGEGDATYGYRVQACYTTACGGWSGTVSVTVLLPPASAPTISGAGTSANGAYTLTWSAVATATAYIVYYDNNGTWTAVQNSAATSYSTTQSANGSYSYVVYACNTGGCSPASAVATETVLFPPSGAPTLTVSQPSLYSDTVDLSWTSVATATSYWWQYSTNQTTWTRLMALQANSTTYAPGTGAFYFEVQACNASGCGPWSAVVEHVVIVK